MRFREIRYREFAAYLEDLNRGAFLTATTHPMEVETILLRAELYGKMEVMLVEYCKQNEIGFSIVPTVTIVNVLG